MITNKIFFLLFFIFSHNINPCCSLKKCFEKIFCSCCFSENKLRKEFEDLKKIGNEILSRDKSEYETKEPKLSDNIKSLNNLLNRSTRYIYLYSEIDNEINRESYGIIGTQNENNSEGEGSLTALANIQFDDPRYQYQTSINSPRTPRSIHNPFLEPISPRS